jgi:quercetin dioxygenase-like cupin family protein
VKTRAIFVPADAGEQFDVMGTPMTMIATAADTASTYEVVLVEAEVNGEPLAHRHPWEEFYFVLEGTLEVEVGARRHVAGPGAFVTIPARAVHSFIVRSGPARFLHVSFGSGATAAFREYHEVAPGVPEPSDIPALLAVNERHGIEVVLPGLGVIAGPGDLARLGDLTDLDAVEDLASAAGA